MITQNKIFLPANCSHMAATLDSELWREYDLSRCCRESRPWARDEDEPLCTTLGSEDEVYRFFWDSSFNGYAMVRVGWSGARTTLRWRYDWFRLPEPDDAPTEAALSFENRVRILDAITATKFWTVKSEDDITGLDGAQWLVEGRRRNVYRGLERFCGGELLALGRLFFELAGPPLSKIELY